MGLFDIGHETRMAECPEHGAFESRGILLPVGERRVWTQCPACESMRVEREAAESRAEAEHARQRRVEEKLARSGIPLRFRGKTLDSFLAQTDAQRHALAVARRFAERFDEHCENGTTAVFSGSPGTGKSHLAIAIAQAVMSRTTVLYAGALDIIRMVRATWGRGSGASEREVLDMLGGVGLLVMDEVGVQYGTDNEKILLFDVINRRYQEMMPTLVLTNLDAPGLREYLGDRAFDRLREAGIWVPFAWESFRGRKGAA